MSQKPSRGNVVTVPDNTCFGCGMEMAQGDQLCKRCKESALRRYDSAQQEKAIKELIRRLELAQEATAVKDKKIECLQNLRRIRKDGGQRRTMGTFDKTLSAVQTWSQQRGLNTAQPVNQMLKLTEETGELAAAIARSNELGAIDAIGDVLVVLTVLCQQMGLNLPACFAVAYETIKDRQGKTINGTFVKGADLKGQTE